MVAQDVRGFGTSVRHLYCLLLHPLGYLSPRSPFTRTPLTSHISSQSDVYSLGVTIMELLHGEQPFAGLELAQASHPRPPPFVEEACHRVNCTTTYCSAIASVPSRRSSKSFRVARWRPPLHAEHPNICEPFFSFASSLIHSSGRKLADVGRWPSETRC